MVHCFRLHSVVVPRWTQVMVVFGLGEGHSRNLSTYLLLLLEYSFPLKPTWEDTREKPWHPVQQLASYSQQATEAGVNPEWDLQQLLKSLQDHATALSSLLFLFYLWFVWVNWMGVCAKEHVWRTRTVHVVGSLPPSFYLYLSSRDQTQVVRFALWGGKQLPIISQACPCCWVTRLPGRVFYVTPWC